jgi:hypothetical protein
MTMRSDEPSSEKESSGIQGKMLLLVILFIVASPFVAMLPLWLGQPPHVVISRNYVAEYNARIAKIPEGERAWPLYIRVAAELENVPEELADDWPASPGDTHWDAALAYLERNAGAMELIRDAARRPHLGMALLDVIDPEFVRVMNERTGDTYEQDAPSENPGLADITLTNLAPVDLYTKVLVVDARASVAVGNAGRFIEDIDAIIALAEQTRQPPLTIANRNGLDLFERACDEIHGVLVDHPNMLSDEHLMQLSSRLSAHAGGDLSPPIEYSRLVFMDIVQRAFTDDGKGNGTVTRDGAELIARFTTSPGARIPPDDIERIAEQSVTRIDLMAEFEAIYIGYEKSRLSPQWIGDKERAFATYSKHRQQPGWKDRHAPLTRIFRELGIMCLHGERAIQIRDATQVAIALELYGRNHGSYPNTLDQLVPEYLDEVPRDRYDGQPLRYERTDDGGVLSSINDPWHWIDTDATLKRWVLFPPESDNN